MHEQGGAKSIRRDTRRLPWKGFLTPGGKAGVRGSERKFDEIRGQSFADGGAVIFICRNQFHSANPSLSPRGQINSPQGTLRADGLHGVIIQFPNGFVNGNHGMLLSS